MTPDCLQKLPVLCLVRGDKARTGLTCTAWLTTTAIVDAARAMLEGGYHLEDLSVLHAREGYVLSYFFDHAGQPGRICLRLLAPHDDPLVPTISFVYQGADWHEREADDFYGIRFEGHPNPIRLFLPSDMDIYPLRKEEAARAFVRTLFPCPPEALSRKKESFTLFDPEPESKDAGTPANKADAASSKD
jgi:NADH-quinone oxidoreductase subunit C